MLLYVPLAVVVLIMFYINFKYFMNSIFTAHRTHLVIWEREIQVGSTRVYISKMSFPANFQKVGGASPIGQPATAA